ncbi:MAG TPA: hypothetical protein VLJ68_12070, partial [Chitinophagaceae bacterium]|nr:hypothetical protein [Chitinophagaceae bacterium]
MHTNTIVNFTNGSYSNPFLPYKFIIDGNAYQMNTPVNYVIPVGLTEVKLVVYGPLPTCNDTDICYYFYPGTYPPDTTDIKAYYGIPSVNQYVTCFAAASTGGFLIGGDRNNNDFQNLPRRGFLIKTKENGCIEWSRMFDSPYLSNIESVNETADGNFLVTGRSEFDYPFMMKIDPLGNPVWSKKITDASGTRFYPYGIKAMVDGGIVLTGKILTSPALVIIRLDNNGNIVWQKAYDKSIQNGQGIRHILQKGNDLFIGGTLSYIDGIGYYGSLVMKLNYNTGQTLCLDEDDAMRRFAVSAGTFYDKHEERERLRQQQVEDERKRKANRKAVIAAAAVAVL